jgi:hypothetical protein
MGLFCGDAKRHGSLWGLFCVVRDAVPPYVLTLLRLTGIIDQKSDILLSLTPTESAQKLINGPIDVAIFLDGWESPAVQQLHNAKSITLENAPRADGFVTLYPFLSKLVCFAPHLRTTVYNLFASHRHRCIK